MKKKFSMLLLTIMCITLISGCANYNKVDESTVFILKKGNVVSTDVENFSSDYDKDELDTFVDEAIKEFVEQNGEKTIKKSKLNVVDDIAKLTLEYDSATTFTEFNGVDLYVGTVSEALGKNYEFDGEFAVVEDGKVTGQTSLVSFNGDEKVVIYKGSSDLKVEGQILYVSAEGVKAISKDKVEIEDGADLLASFREPESEAIENTENTEVVTEILEDEPSDVEDTEMVFEFPEEEKEESKFSSVYTYVIYK